MGATNTSLNLMTAFLRYFLSFFDFTGYFSLFYDSSELTTASSDVETKEINVKDRERLVKVFPKDDCEVWRELFAMNRNLKRRNSKRFVIGDGDDESSVNVPEMTITEATGDENVASDWIPIENNKLKVRSTLT